MVAHLTFFKPLFGAKYFGKLRVSLGLTKWHSIYGFNEILVSVYSKSNFYLVKCSKGMDKGVRECT